MTRFTRAAGRWFTFGVFLGTALSCGRVFAGDRLHQKGQLVAVPVTAVTAPAQAVSVPIYSVPVVQAVPMQFGYIQPMQAGAVYLSAPTQSAAVTTAQAPVINIKLEVPSTPAMTATVLRRARIPTAQAASVACPAPSVAAAPQVTYAVPASPTYAVYERSCVSAGGTHAALRCLEGPHRSLQAPPVLQEQVSLRHETCSAAYDIPLVRAGQIPGGLSGADSFLAADLAWLGQ